MASIHPISDCCNCIVCLEEGISQDRLILLCSNSDAHTVCNVCFEELKKKTPIQMKCPMCRSAVKPSLLPAPQSVYNLPIRYPEAIPLNGQYAIYHFYFDGMSLTDHEGNEIELNSYRYTLDEIRTYYNNPRLLINNRSGAKNGVTVVMDIYGRVLERIEYRHNQVHGTYKVYENGQLIEMSEYVHGQLHGPSMIFYTEYEQRHIRRDGLPPVEMIIHYENGEQTGDVTTFYENGHMDEVFPNRDATLADGFNGTYKCYYSTGQLKVEIEYEDNVPHGPYAVYSKSGMVLERGTFKRGKIEGEIFSKLVSTIEMIRAASQDLTDVNPVIASMANPELYIQKVIGSHSAKKYCVTIHDFDPKVSIHGTVSGPEQRFESRVEIIRPNQMILPVFHHGICVSTGC